MNNRLSGYQTATLEVGALYFSEVRNFFNKLKLKGYDIEFYESSGIIEREFTYRAKPDVMEKIKIDINRWLKHIENMEKQEALEEQMRKEKSLSFKVSQTIGKALDFIKCNNKKEASFNHYLLKAAGLDEPDGVINMLSAGADVNHQDIHGNTALHYAALAGSFKCIEVLVDHGIDVHLENKQGETAYDYVKSRGKTEVIDFLNTLSDDRAPH